MTKWEYWVEIMPKEHLKEDFNTLGQKGWELVALEMSDASYPRCVFKRPLNDAERE